MTQPLISVIVPCYNVEEYLPKCVESILNQTYRNLEIFLVNDGSLDRSGEICDEYVVKDTRIKVIHKEYLQPIITQYFIDNKSEIWLLFLIAHSKR